MPGPRARKISLFDRRILTRASLDSVRKLSPRVQMANPVMFVVEVGSVLTTLLWVRDAVAPSPGAAPLWFTGTVTLWLWFTVLFANFAESVAEGRGKAQADTLRKMRKETSARRQGDDGFETVPASALRKGDVVVVETKKTWYTYRMQSSQIVSPNQSEVLLPVPGQPGAAPDQARITLTTCHPRWASTQRLIWFGSLVRSQPKAAGAPAGITPAATGG